MVGVDPLRAPPPTVTVTVAGALDHVVACTSSNSQMRKREEGGLMKWRAAPTIKAMRPRCAAADTDAGVAWALSPAAACCTAANMASARARAVSPPPWWAGWNDCVQARRNNCKCQTLKGGWRGHLATFPRSQAIQHTSKYSVWRITATSCERAACSRSTSAVATPSSLPAELCARTARRTAEATAAAIKLDDTVSPSRVAEDGSAAGRSSACRRLRGRGGIESVQLQKSIFRRGVDLPRRTKPDSGAGTATRKGGTTTGCYTKRCKAWYE